MDHQQQVRPFRERAKIRLDDDNLVCARALSQDEGRALFSRMKLVGQQRRQHRHFRRGRIVELRDQADELVFQQRIALRREKRNGDVVRRRIAADDPEIQRLAAIGRRRRQSGGYHAVLFLGERFRLDLAQFHLAFALRCNLGHQLADTVSMRADRREVGAELTRIDKLDLHWLDQPLHHAFCRCRERIEPVGGEIRARPAKPSP